jgi:prevent-host-death family protein
VKVISQRELRNDNAAVMRAVEDGESYTVTRRGVPVARLAPLDDDADLRCLRPARTRQAYSEIDRIVAPTSVAEVLADLRGER